MYITVGLDSSGVYVPISVPTCGVGGKVYCNSGANMSVMCTG